MRKWNIRWQSARGHRCNVSDNNLISAIWGFRLISSSPLTTFASSPTEVKQVRLTLTSLTSHFKTRFITTKYILFVASGAGLGSSSNLLFHVIHNKQNDWKNACLLFVYCGNFLLKFTEAYFDWSIKRFFRNSKKLALANVSWKFSDLRRQWNFYFSIVGRLAPQDSSRRSSSRGAYFVSSIPIEWKWRHHSLEHPWGL